MAWILLKSGQEIARHSTKLARCIEAIERGMGWLAGKQTGLHPGVEIKEVEENTHDHR